MSRELKAVAWREQVFARAVVLQHEMPELTATERFRVARLDVKLGRKMDRLRKRERNIAKKAEK